MRGYLTMTTNSASRSWTRSSRPSRPRALKTPSRYSTEDRRGSSLLLEASRKVDRADRTVLLTAARSFVKALSQYADGTLGFAASAMSNIADKLAPEK